MGRYSNNWVVVLVSGFQGWWARPTLPDEYNERMILMAKLAINGGSKAISQVLLNRAPSWPMTYEEVPDMLRQVYLSQKWSFNKSYEQEFCRAFAAHHSAKHGVFMVNGTVTLEAALAALGVGEGDEVIVPGLTWMATAMAALYVGAKPVFADLEESTWCLDVESVKKAITKKTKAIIPVHLYGSMADMEALLDLAQKHGLHVIEDCAHAHGGMWDGRGVGSIGTVGSFSMQESKTLTSGEGGMCITNDAELAERMFRYSHIGYHFGSAQGQAASGPPEGLVCHNYRCTEFQAVILLAGLKRLQEQTEKRDENAKYFAELVADVPGVTMQARGRKAGLQGYYAMGLRVDLAQFGGVSLGRLSEALGAEGFGIGGTYGPVYKHMLWNVPVSDYGMVDGGCVVCDRLCESEAMVTMHYGLLGEKELIAALAGAVRKVAENKGEL